MTTPGKNKSIYFDAERLEMLDRVEAELYRQTGIHISDSAIMMRALTVLFLAVCPPEQTNDTHERQPIEA